MRRKKLDYKEIEETLSDILTSPVVDKMKNIVHHGKISVYNHSKKVTALAYKINKFFSLHCNQKTLLTSAMLHDFYLYDWHIVKHDEYHAYYHPKEALKNAEHYFGKLTDKQTDMILAHMWPMHLMPPRSKEGMILTAADKICASLDFMGLSKKFMPIYERINEVVGEYEHN